MAFTVEDGTVVLSANAYIDVAFFDEYHTDRNNADALNLCDEDKEAGILYATSWFERSYFNAWKGIITTEDYPRLAWPRENVFIQDGRVEIPTNVIPVSLKEAVAEVAAQHHLVSGGNVNAEQNRVTIREKVAVLEVEYSRDSPDSVTFPFAVSLIQDLIVGGGSGGIRVPLLDV
jgi:hypothetical protein